MAVSHVKSSTIGDFTGTVTVHNSTGGTATVAATNLVRPSDWNSAHNQLYSLAGNTTNASSASGTNVYLSGGPGIVVGGYTGSLAVQQRPMDGFDPYPMGNAELLGGQLGQSTLFLQPVYIPAPVVFNNIQFPVHFTGASNSTGSYTLSNMLGLYTYANATQITRVHSFEVTTGISHNGTQNSASNVGGIRTWAGTVAATTIEPGRYFAALGSKTASANANATISNFVLSNMNTAVSGGLGVANNASQRYAPFMGSFSVQTAGLPATIGTVDMRGSAAVNLRPTPWMVYST